MIFIFSEKRSEYQVNHQKIFSKKFGGENMQYSSYFRLGKIFKERREELKIRIKDLVDSDISAGTISNFETGRRKVRDEKILRLFNKIGVEEHELENLVTNDQKRILQLENDLEVELLSIENDIDLVSPQISLQRLNEIKKRDVNKSSTTLIEFLTAQAYYKKDKLDIAEYHYYEVMKACSGKKEKHNLLANAYYELSRISYRQTNLAEALEFVGKGIAAFNDSGERQYIKYHLLLSKAIYLDKLEQRDEAQYVLNTLWDQMEHIDTETALNMYQLTASLYIKSKRYEAAVDLCKQGINIARRNRSYDRSFELWVTLGDAYSQQGELNQAKICLETASRFENKTRRKFLTIQNEIQLGKIYLKENQHEEAITILTNAMGKAKKEKDSLLLLQCLQSLADCHMQAQDQLVAISYYEDAIEIAEHHKLLNQQRDLALQLSVLFEKRDLVKYTKYTTMHYKLSVKLSKHGGGLLMFNSEHLPNTSNAVADPPDS